MGNSDGDRLGVRKMYKLFIGGEFVRSESGRSDRIGAGESVANVARASRKDLRDAVAAARAAFAGWAGRAPYHRGQILYRLAEMLEARTPEFTARLREGAGLSKSAAVREVGAAVDRTVWYAGWCDKYAALMSNRNPVAGPHFNFSSAEAVGVVVVTAPDLPALLGFVSVAVPALVAGNTVVALASERDPRTALVVAEAVATSDLPKGVLNILSGPRAELVQHAARHMEVGALDLVSDDTALGSEMQSLSAENLKRTWVRPAGIDWFAGEAQSLDAVTRFTEIKTIWHPAGV